MTLKRLILGVLTLSVVFLLLGPALFRSLGEPQVTSLLELYQTDLLLHATEPQTASGESDEFAQIRRTVLGEEPLEKALEQYKEVRKSAASDLTDLEKRLNGEASAVPVDNVAPAIDADRQRLTRIMQQQRSLLQQLDLRIGILHSQNGDTSAALQTWSQLQDPPYRETATVLSALWSEPPRILPDADTVIENNLQGWFRYVELERLYELQQRTTSLQTLRAEESAIARNTLIKLALVGTVPALGSILGIGLLIFLIGQRLQRGTQSILAIPEGLTWETPWDWETVWQVLLLGFFFVGQFVLPLLLSGLRELGIGFSAFGTRAQAISALTFYLLMAVSALSVLYFSIRKYRPLPEGWFQLRVNWRWLLWGVGGYLVALPLMLGVSLINQQIWQGQGGSNPLLQIVLQEGDPIALSIFFVTAAVAAPVFEEMLFRGFLLPSLTRYLPVWGAIALSSLIFAIAHLSLSEVIPLTVLGGVLGFIYTRSRNLLAPMLLHSLWNSVTMIGLFILGSGAK